MKLGILTGGGDVPGLNVVIKTVVEKACLQHWQVLGIRRGWLGLLSLDGNAKSADWIMPLTPETVRTIGRDGGTILHTSRIEPQMLPRSVAPAALQKLYGTAGTIDASPQVLSAIAALGLDAIVAVGGDGTLRFAARLAREGFPIISIPKTMDNDVFGTDYAIGFSTAITRSVEAISALRTTAASHERILIVELFGRACGQTALYTGLMCDADRTFIAESPFDPMRAAQLLEADRRANASRYAIAVISEGAQIISGKTIEKGTPDAYGRRRLGGIGEVLGAACTNASAESVIVQNLAYLMRSGPPDAMDRQIAIGFGTLAVELLAGKRAGRMCALDGGRFKDVDIALPLAGAKRVDVARSYDAVAYKPRLSALNGAALFGL